MQPVAPRAEEVTLLTATRAGRRWRQQRFKFWVARRPRWVAQNVGRRRPLPAEFKRLDFIHAAGWYDVGQFPQLPGCEPEDPHYRWVVFVSNFDRGWLPYLDSFIDGFGHGIYGLWSKTVGFPRFPGPGTRYALQRWVETRHTKAGHYYVAYPGATTHDVRAALRVHREHEAFQRQVDRAAGPLGEALGLARTLQNCLGESIPVGRDLHWGPEQSEGIARLVSFAPVVPGREAEIEALLAGLPVEPSPFSRLPGTHFGRLTLIDRMKAGVHPRQQVTLNNSWLMLTVDFDSTTARRYHGCRPPYVELRRYFDALDDEADLVGLWNRCQARELYASLADYLIPTVVEPLVEYIDYPDAPLRNVVMALETADTYRAEVRKLVSRKAVPLGK